MEYNLNNEDIYIKSLDFGKMQDIKIKVGRKSYYMDIDKNSSCTFISLYNYVNKDRKEFSKYAAKANLYHIRVFNTAIISKNFIYDIEKISNAQKIYDKYSFLK